MSKLDEFASELLKEGYIKKVEASSDIDDSPYDRYLTNDSGVHIDDFLIGKGFAHTSETDSLGMTFEIFSKDGLVLQHRNQAQLSEEGESENYDPGFSMRINN